MTRYSQEDKDRARTHLSGCLRPGSTVYTVLRHVSASGMSRWISLLVPGTDKGSIADISWHAARLLELPVNSRNHEGIHAEGCGMDMGFHLVYGLGRALYPTGFDCAAYFPARDLVTYRRCANCPASESRARPGAYCGQSESGGYYGHHFVNSGDPYRAIDPARPRKILRREISCPANDHFNCAPAETPYHHSDGGYALRHRWI